MKMVTIAEFYDLNAAYLLRSRLEAEDIPVFLQNEFVNGMNPLNFVAYGGTSLQVPVGKVERAMVILQELEPAKQQESQSAIQSTNGYRGGLRVLGILTVVLATWGLLWGIIRYLANHGG